MMTLGIALNLALACPLAFAATRTFRIARVWSNFGPGLCHNIRILQTDDVDATSLVFNCDRRGLLELHATEFPVCIWHLPGDLEPVAPTWQWQFANRDQCLLFLEELEVAIQNGRNQLTFETQEKQYGS